MKIITFILVVLLACTVSAGLWDGVQAEAPVKSPAVKAAPKTEAKPEKKAALSIGKVSKNKIAIDLVNSVPVRGVQFTMLGVKMTEVRAVSRTTGFFVKFNEETGIAILASTTADEIAPGKGPIAEVVFEKIPGFEAGLSDIMLVDSNRNLI